MTFGEKIQKLRKQQGFSQEVLAEKVTVTRQTISKWELDQSTPDLEFIAQLSDIFNVSTDYLIKEELSEPAARPTQKKRFPLSEKARRMTFVLWSVTLLAAVVVCLICDYFTSDSLAWSFIAILSIVAVWCVMLPCLTAKKKIVLKTLFTASIIPIPFLALLSLLLDVPVVLTLGTCISLVSIAAVWMIYAIFRKCRNHLWRAFGFALLVMIPVPIMINHITAYFIRWNDFKLTSDIFNSSITLVLSALCFVMDYLVFQKEKEEKA